MSDGEGSTTISNGYIVSEGVYELTVKDEALNEKTISFTVDLSKPKFNVVSGTHFDESADIVISDFTFDYVEVYNQDTGKSYKETNSSFALTEEATYRLIAYDKTGKSKVIWIAIDKTNPKITATGTGVGAYFRKDVTLTVFDKFLTEVKVNDDVYTVSDFTSLANNENRTFEKVYTEPGVYHVVAKDKFGRETPYTFTIDKTVPSVNIEKGGYYKDPITLEITEEYLHKAELTLPNGETVTVTTGYVIDGQGVYSLKVRDKAYNLLEISFTIDYEAPKFQPEKWSYTLEVDKDAQFACPDMTEYVTDNLSGVASVKLDKWYSENWSIPDQTKVGSFVCRYISTDKAGNSVSNDIFYDVVDTTPPVVTLYNDKGTKLESGVFQNKNVKIVIEDESQWTAVLKDQNGKVIEFENGGFVTTRGNFDLTVTDEYGNETVVSFAIDKDYPLVYLNQEKHEKVSTEINYYNKTNTDGVTLNVSDLNIETIVLTKDGSEIEFVDGMIIKNQGIYVITATDKAGNKTEVHFTIDYEAPKFQPEKWSYTLEVDKDAQFVCPDMTEYVTDNLSGVASVKLDKWYSENWSIPDQTKVGSFVCRYISTDKAGNSVSNDIFYDVVDTTAPTLQISSDSIGVDGVYSKLVLSATDNYYLDYYLINEKYQSTITNLTTTHGRTFVGGHLVEGKNTIVVYDKSGNVSNTIEFTYDSTANVEL